MRSSLLNKSRTPRKESCSVYGRRSEIEFATELQDTRVTGGRNLTGRTCVGTAKACTGRERRTQPNVDVAPLGVIEHVVSLQPQLNANVLGEVDVLVEGHVPVLQPWTIDRVAVEVAKRA